jgi:hypothetical protein
MNIRVETKPAVWGAFGGAIATAMAGFACETVAKTGASDAGIVALAPVCVERFQRAGDASAALADQACAHLLVPA